MQRHIKQILQIIILATTILISFLHGTVLRKATKCSITVYLVHTTSDYNQVSRISGHSPSVEISKPSTKSKVRGFCCFSPYQAVQKETKRLQNCARISAYCSLQTHYNVTQNMIQTVRKIAYCKSCLAIPIQHHINVLIHKI